MGSRTPGCELSRQMGRLIRISIRFHLTRPLRILLTIAGIGAAVALLFATAVLNATLRASIDMSARGIGGDAGLEVVAPIGGGVSPTLRQAAARTRGVDLAVPVVRTTARMRSGDSSERALVLGVPPDFTRLFSGELGSAAGEIAGLRATSARLGPALGHDPGSHPVELETPSGWRRIGPVEPISPVPFADLNGGSFVVVGIEAADALFAKRGRADVLYVKAASGTPIAVLRERLDLALRGRAVVRSPGSEAKAYRQTFDSLAQLTELGAVGALWVALFAVFNAMSMSLLERRRTVALLSTLGASRIQLAAAFLVEAVAFGALGSALGIGLGYLVAKVLLGQALSAYPFLPLASTGELRIVPSMLAMIAAASVAVAVLGAAVPIRRTLKAAPVESLSLDSSFEWARYRSESRPHGTRFGFGLLCCLTVAGCVLFGLPSGSSGWVPSGLLVLLLTGVMLALPPVVATLVRVAEWLLRRVSGTLGPLATGSLVKNRGRTAIMVGVLALSLSLAISLGTALVSFESTMTSVFADRYGPPLYVTAASYSGVTSDQPLPGQIARRIGRVPGVRAVYPERYLPFDIRGRQVVAVSAPMRREAGDGFSNAIANTHGAPRQSIIAGLERGGVVPSVYTAALHDLDIGRRFLLPGLPRHQSLEVVGVYDDVLSIETMYMERSTYVRLSGDTSIDRIAVAPEAGRSLGDVRRSLERFLGAGHVPAIVETRAALIDKILGNVRGAFAIARAIQLAALIIAGLIVASTMLTTVNERRWEFAMCRALGMSRVRIRGGVLLEAMVVGVIGAAIALVVGLATGVLMLEMMESQFLWAIGYAPAWSQLVAAMAVAIAAVVAVALVPARIAGRSSVVEALSSA